MKFETTSPNGVSITLGSSQDGDAIKVPSPKALMLSSLAVCSGLDVVSILEKMKVNLEDFISKILSKYLANLIINLIKI